MAKVQASKKTVETWIGLVVLAIVVGVAWYFMQTYAPKADEAGPACSIQTTHTSCVTIVVNWTLDGVTSNKGLSDSVVKVHIEGDITQEGASTHIKQDPNSTEISVKGNNFTKYMFLTSLPLSYDNVGGTYKTTYNLSIVPKVSMVKCDPYSSSITVDPTRASTSNYIKADLKNCHTVRPNQR